ncbi:hypothetical protein BaRGS_00004140 [Batillaria attramentaria]|uniref:Uncharacterized protein n=1 Tax=Batillaria attramentaria TaxID=370345 RepID=A0ABD0M049_9CAEN
MQTAQVPLSKHKPESTSGGKRPKNGKRSRYVHTTKLRQSGHVYSGEHKHSSVPPKAHVDTQRSGQSCFAVFPLQTGWDRLRLEFNKGGDSHNQTRRVGLPACLSESVSRGYWTHRCGHDQRRPSLDSPSSPPRRPGQR